MRRSVVVTLDLDGGEQFIFEPVDPPVGGPGTKYQARTVQHDEGDEMVTVFAARIFKHGGRVARNGTVFKRPLMDLPPEIQAALLGEE